MDSLGQQQYKDSVLTYNALSFFCLLMILDFNLMINLLKNGV